MIDQMIYKGKLRENNNKAKTSVSSKKTTKNNLRTRKSFGKIPEAMEMPNLIDVQTESYKWFIEQGVEQVLKDMNPTVSNSNTMSIEFGNPRFEAPKFDIDECKDKDVSFQSSMYVQIKFSNYDTGEISEQEVFMGRF